MEKNLVVKTKNFGTFLIPKKITLTTRREYDDTVVTQQAKTVLFTKDSSLVIFANSGERVSEGGNSRTVFATSENFVAYDPEVVSLTRR